MRKAWKLDPVDRRLVKAPAEESKPLIVICEFEESSTVRKHVEPLSLNLGWMSLSESYSSKK
jgi:hypothetical protein